MEGGGRLGQGGGIGVEVMVGGMMSGVGVTVEGLEI